jgi:histidinol-phosphate aminotransferase
VLSRVEGRSAADLHQQLFTKGILVRYYDKPDLRDFIRISAGKPEQIDQLLITLREL